jgi:hypothetical protein
MRDLLDDIATVLEVDRWNMEKVPAADIPARLRTLAPGSAPYRSINGLEIRRYLETAHGVKVPATGHKYPVAPAAIREAILRGIDPGAARWSRGAEVRRCCCRTVIELRLAGRRAGSRNVCRRLGNPYCTWPSSVWGPEGSRYSSGW